MNKNSKLKCQLMEAGFVPMDAGFTKIRMWFWL